MCLCQCLQFKKLLAFLAILHAKSNGCLAIVANIQAVASVLEAIVLSLSILPVPAASGFVGLIARQFENRQHNINKTCMPTCPM